MTGGKKEQLLVSLFDLLEDLDGKLTRSTTDHKQSQAIWNVFERLLVFVCNSGAVPGGVPEGGGRGCGVGWRLQIVQSILFTQTLARLFRQLNA